MYVVENDGDDDDEQRSVRLVMSVFKTLVCDAAYKRTRQERRKIPWTPSVHTSKDQSEMTHFQSFMKNFETYLKTTENV